MSDPAALRARAEGLAGAFPPLLAGARHLAASVVLGAHGRRRPGQGDEFWQYRPAIPGDEARSIDWRRSGRSDAHFVRQKEWQAAQSVSLWIDPSASMAFASDSALPEKRYRAAELGLALAILLVRGGERVGLMGHDLPARGGEVQLMRLAAAMEADPDGEYGEPTAREMPSRSRAAFVSDFLGDISAARAALTEAADRGVSGVMIQVLDPQEEAFPFDGRTVFESMGGGIRHETLKARDLRDRYLDRLAERKADLADLCRATGWQYHCHHTNTPATQALLWAYSALERVV
ncbi:hypothetical protein PARPLA_00959 [Rhodobacteraceae bacterium THAF1]|uniref:DUF58 domain-containing protein n=1 Tax=Palleronia sp. THAF1 TaxID=2587842 RepID=UPI000F3AFE7D|nr:DUF58 domain-containing protein [Palleronia sp. THAF1]QFU07495.1 hypothetical protein FIU81_02270 [Palleronia sp. THAF1]VDC20448.1 hypothetical protein PARPLA_00959 [Rhodobacteraceae bacterium THAF1]